MRRVSEILPVAPSVRKAMRTPGHSLTAATRTACAKSKPVTESLSEAFTVYHTDPDWMQRNQPELFAWFEVVKKTGKAPTK